MSPARRPVHPLHTLSRLHAEWRTLATDSAAVASARSWRLPIVSIDSLDDVLSAAGMRLDPPVAGTSGRGASGRVAAEGRSVLSSDAAPVGDELLRLLVVLARTDALAARVVLQRLLPGLSAVARRHGRCHAEHLAALDELVAIAWPVIREFPVERRNHHLAAALLRDCEHQAFRKPTRRLMVLEVTEPNRLDRPADEAQSEPLLELCRLVDAARARHLGPDDLVLLRLLLSGRRLDDVAREMAVSQRTVRNRRGEAIHRLRASVAADAA